ncbi:UNVERIFIED_CONTAM: hypothetical protein BEN50_01575 [Euhalothece sp. KZN 001]
MWKRWRFIILFVVLILGFSLNENPFLKLDDVVSPPPIPENIKLEPWQQQLGNKIRTLRRTIPTANCVVLVPDQATFLVAIQQWNLKRRYPILLEDDQYTPLFLNRFQPQAVIRLSSVNQEYSPKIKTVMKEAVAAAWESEEKSLKKTWQQLGWKPPGVVITTVDDPASLAAVALAADRGQPLLFLEGYFGEINQTLSSRGWKYLDREVNHLVKSTGYDYETLGDTIDTITIARTLPVKYKSPNNNQLLAVTDGLGRDQNGKRYAIAGWIYGSPERSVYQAMCAIFLEAKTAFLYDSYPRTPSWENYHFEQAKRLLEAKGLEVKLIKQPEASLETWQKITSQSWRYDLVFINSRGGKANFAVGNGDATVQDIPNLNVPAAMQMIHSFSATTPDDNDTIAGRWLNQGVYAYIGSVDEPYVTGFVPPKYVVMRLVSNVPFLVSSRYVDTPTWKIITIGDPLMLIQKK